MSINNTVAVQKEESWFVAKSLETGVVSQGKSIEEAIANLREAVALFFEDETEVRSFEPIYVTSMEVAI